MKSLNKNVPVNAALKKRLSLVFQNCEHVLILASAKPLAFDLFQPLQKTILSNFENLKQSEKLESFPLHFLSAFLKNKTKSGKPGDLFQKQKAAGKTLPKDSYQKAKNSGALKVPLLCLPFRESPGDYRSGFPQSLSLKLSKNFVQKTSFPKHALNCYCSNFHFPIQGCHIDLLVLKQLQKNQEKSSLISYISSETNIALLLKTHFVALLVEPLFKVENQPETFNLQYQQQNNMPLHFNQLSGAFVKSEKNHVSYIGHAEIKQTLLLQQSYKRSLFLKQSPKTLVLQSFRETFSKLDFLLLSTLRLQFKYIKTLIFILNNCHLKLISYLALKQGENHRLK